MPADDHVGRQIETQLAGFPRQPLRAEQVECVREKERPAEDDQQVDLAGVLQQSDAASGGVKDIEPDDHQEPMTDARAEKQQERRDRQRHGFQKLLERFGHAIIIRGGNPKQIRGRNPKSETRNPKQIQNPKNQNPKQIPDYAGAEGLFGILSFFAFEFVSDFGFRISSFHPGGGRSCKAASN